MFDLETAIKNWRRQIEKSCGGDPIALAELEDHLREDVAALMRAGKSESDAFSAAIVRFGDPAALRREFAKVDCLSTLDRCTLGALLTAAAILAAIALPAILLMRGDRLRDQPLLLVHVLSVTLGYSAGLFVAAFAGYATVRRFVARTSVPMLTTTTLRIVRVGSMAAAALTLLAFVLGAIWANNAWGRPFNMDPHEIGALLVLGGCLTTAFAAQRHSIPAHVSLALAIASAALVLAAWFGVLAIRTGFPLMLTTLTTIAVAVTLGLAAMALKVQDKSVAG
jgi:hypothetical protein